MCRFILVLTELLELFHKLLKKNVPLRWDEEQQKALQKVNGVLSSPLSMIIPIKDFPITLYLTSINKSIGTF